MLYQNSITVVITTYNSAEYINKSILSVLKQSVSIKKIIIIDDSSLDFKALENKFNKIKKEYTNVDFKLIHNKKNKGPGFSRNFAWDIVDTEFIAFLDSDDIWETDKLEKQLKIFNSSENLSLVATAKNKKIKNYKSGYIHFNKMLFHNLIPLSSVLIKSNIPYRFKNRYYAEDYELWLNMLYDNLSIFIINEVLCHDNNELYKNNLSDNYLPMTIETQKTLSKFYFKKKSNFYIFLAKVFELFKFMIRILRIIKK